MNNDNDSYIELKLLSIFSIACVGSGQMFLPIFYKQVLGLGNDKIGFISSITPFVSFIAFPYWTTLIDKTHAYKRIMITNMLIALICILSIGAVPYLSDEDWIRILLISICCFGYAFFGFPVIAALVDTVILKALANRKDLYGRQKIGVPIGFAISVFLTGLLMEKLDTPYALFIVFATSNILFVLTVWYMDFEDKDDKQVIFVNDNNDVKSVTEYGATSSNGSSSIVVEDEHEVDDETVNFLKDIENDDRMTVSMWHLLKDPEACQFFYSMILVGCSIAVVLAFLYLFIETDLHGSPTLIGLLGPLGSSTELVCFFFSKEVNITEKKTYKQILIT
ncbi:MAG: major facilitator superfamily domain-containing protein [Benjaminiella poitrasii]|nr:MAG: major facilitator superfamily domain-containing protein [Benjaminiella poitrasii]